MHRTNQVHIVHLTDIHFGRFHRFRQPISITGDPAIDLSYPTLLEKLKEDLQGDDPGVPVIICITGDFAEIAAYEEFQEAESFINALAKIPILGRARGVENIFIVPGNHDVKYDGQDVGARWQQYADFYNRLYGQSIRRESPWDYFRVHNLIKERGLLVVCLNSSIFVEKGKPDENRGRLDIKQLDSLETNLESIPQNDLSSSIRIALIHHHPVLIPALADPGKGYDAIHNSGMLLATLRKYGFHVILHGHKHNPNTFTDDTNDAYQSDSSRPILIVAGGTTGSKEIPNGPNCCNCYNRIIIKWHPGAQQTRIQTETRGLNIFDRNGKEKLPSRWKWKSLKLDDRSFFEGSNLPNPKKNDYQPYEDENHGSYNKQRQHVYEETKGNLAVVEVMPSLVPGHAYEARFWIVPHKINIPPAKVTWSAGPYFDVIEITRDEDPLFCAIYNYWGPMLIQAKLEFANGETAFSYVYARMPTNYS